MLYDFYRETTIEYKCEKCQRIRNCKRKFNIWKLPPILIIHLNRYCESLNIYLFIIQNYYSKIWSWIIIDKKRKEKSSSTQNAGVE